MNTDNKLFSMPMSDGRGSCNPASAGSMRWWIAEMRCRAVKTILVQASSRIEAQQKLDEGGGEGTDVSYYDIGPAKVIRRDKPSNNDSASR
jgi:hypothetical protein